MPRRGRIGDFIAGGFVQFTPGLPRVFSNASQPNSLIKPFNNRCPAHRRGNHENDSRCYWLPPTASLFNGVTIFDAVKCNHMNPFSIYENKYSFKGENILPQMIIRKYNIIEVFKLTTIKYVKHF